MESEQDRFARNSKFPALHTVLLADFWKALLLFSRLNLLSINIKTCIYCTLCFIVEDEVKDHLEKAKSEDVVNEVVCKCKQKIYYI